MVVDSVTTLVEALHQHRLLNPVQLEELTQSLQAQFREPRALARELLQRQWLTPYQINHLFQGRTPELVLGKYVLLERLAEGAMGQVYKAKHRHMKRVVALKVIRENLLSQPEAVARFYKEIQDVSQLTHSNIVGAYDAGPIGRSHFFAMEYIEGTDLGRLVQQSGRLCVSQACDFIRQAVLGLQHAHERGLLHHDLKPTNLMVTRRAGRAESEAGDEEGKPQQPADATASEQLKIRNLGLTIFHAPGKHALVPHRASNGEVPGTADFLAPEHALTDRPVDIRANLYSLGCIFYYLLTARVPFPGGSATDKLHRHLKEHPRDVQAIGSDVPAEVAAVVRHLLAKRPEDRYQTPADLFAALTPLPTLGTLSSTSWSTVQSLANVGITPTPPRGQNPAAPGTTLNPGALQACKPAGPLLTAGSARQARQAASRRRHWWIAAAAPVLLLGLGVLTWLLVRQPDPPPASPAGESRRPESAPRAYVKKLTQQETVLASLRASHLPTFEGKWFYIGPFDNSDKKGFATTYPPEREINLAQTYPGKGNAQVGWKEFPKFGVGRIINLKLFQGPNNDNACVYLFHEYEAEDSTPMTLSLGSDDTLTVWHNGKEVLANPTYRGAAADQDRVLLRPRIGKNQLLFKICQGTGDWAFYIFPVWPEAMERAFGERLRREFPSP